MHISSNGEVGIKKWRLTAPAEASSVWFFLPLAKSPLLLLSSPASRPASPPLCRYLHFFFFFFFSFSQSSSASHPLLPATYPICRPGAAHSRAVRENSKKIIIIPSKKKPLLGWGGLQYDISIKSMHQYFCSF